MLRSSLHARPTCRLAMLAVATLLASASAAPAAFVPWDPLTADSWIYVGAPQQRIKLYTANAGAYEVGFDRKQSSGAARGENSLRFADGAVTSGRLSSNQLTGSFTVTNVGDNRTFHDLIILVAIDAAALPADFAMSLGVQGRAAYSFDRVDDFAAFSHPEYSTGRPSGYYSATSPTGEGIAYDFTDGIVTLWAAQGANLGPLGGTAQFDYSFSSLPGRVVFSVYGYDANIGWVYHTNRSVLDANRPSETVSTFEVVPEPAVVAVLLIGAGVLRRRRRG